MRHYHKIHRMDILLHVVCFVLCHTARKQTAMTTELTEVIDQSLHSPPSAADGTANAHRRTSTESSCGHSFRGALRRRVCLLNRIDYGCACHSHSLRDRITTKPSSRGLRRRISLGEVHRLCTSILAIQFIIQHICTPHEQWKSANPKSYSQSSCGGWWEEERTCCN